MVVLSPAAASPAASAPPRHLRGGFPSCPNLGVTPQGCRAWVQPSGFLRTVTRTALLTPSSHSHWLHKSLGQVLEVSTRQHRLGPWLPAAVPSRALCWGHLPLQSPREPRRSTPSNAHPPCIRAGRKPTPHPCDTVLSHKGSRPAPAVATTVRWQCGQAPAKRTVPWSCQDMAPWWGQQAGRAMQCLPGWLRAPHLVLTAAPGTQGLSCAARASLSAPIYICCVCKLRVLAAWQHRTAAENPPQLCQPWCYVCASGSSHDPVTRLQSLFCPRRMAIILEHAPRAAPSSPAVGPWLLQSILQAVWVPGALQHLQPYHPQLPPKSTHAPGRQGCGSWWCGSVDIPVLLPGRALWWLPQHSGHPCPLPGRITSFLVFTSP